MHICPEEIAVLMATVPALRYLVAWLIRQRAVRVFWVNCGAPIGETGNAKPTLHCASCHEEIKEEGQ